MSKTYQYTVRGRGPFPFDMLRYDASWPTSAGVAPLSADTREDLYNMARDVQLNSVRKPTVDRWRSFGWYVGEVRTLG